ncbi:sugar transferase [Bacteriovoracaceae bacterium]|nr:sugar transferase [Bacteriovoracaceae bacterium]
MAKKLFDIILALLIGLIISPIFLLIYLFIFIVDKGPALYWSKRVGKDNKLFLMPKFKTMKSTTPQIATHLLENPQSYLIFGGKLLRKASLDEIPQLWSILKGDMSFVGPRPALFNQDDLIELRSKKGIHHLTPGLTGLAQINGRDEISIEEKVKLDEEYLKNSSFFYDLKIIFQTGVRVLNQKDISH